MMVSFWRIWARRYSRLLEEGRAYVESSEDEEEQIEDSDDKSDIVKRYRSVNGKEGVGSDGQMYKAEPRYALL